MYAVALCLLIYVHWSEIQSKYKNRHYNRSNLTLTIPIFKIAKRGFQVSLLAPPMESHIEKLIFFISLLQIHDKSPLRKILPTTHLGALTAKKMERTCTSTQTKKNTQHFSSVCHSVNIIWQIVFSSVLSEILKEL